MRGTPFVAAFPVLEHETEKLRELLSKPGVSFEEVAKHPAFFRLWHDADSQLIDFVIDRFDDVLNCVFEGTPTNNKFLKLRCVDIVKTGEPVRTILFERGKLGEFVMMFLRHAHEFSREKVSNFFSIASMVVLPSTGFHPYFETDEFFTLLLGLLNYEHCVEFFKFVMRRQTPGIAKILKRIKFCSILVRNVCNDTGVLRKRCLQTLIMALEEDTVSQKGIKGENTYTINGGTFTIDSADDCLHAGGTMTFAAGEFTLSSGDDAVHCDNALVIQSGTFTIPYCYEGIEGLSITIEDGTFDITSSDDGLNAAGGADSSGFGGFGGRPQDTFASNEDIFITITGGTFAIVSSGDCIDSNGDLTINGGTLELTCNGNGDTALDCDGTYTNNGGEVTTNDGSEENPGQMGGGQPGGGRQDGTNGGRRPDGQTVPSNP